ncbi:MAG: hypothetical protein KatS3mg087_0578 [Patescibacteria group bacterium]|nr:MAG: hypothetical protein KatS3mg087_0578 [Patescibacteria group bacterium]
MEEIYISELTKDQLRLMIRQIVKEEIARSLQGSFRVPVDMDCKETRKR